MNFEPFPKMPRLNRECVITEKLDGTNAQVFITPAAEVDLLGPGTTPFIARVGDLMIAAGSRSRWVTVGKSSDNYGFASWVSENADELAKLGPGRHYGEWWGRGINRGYGLEDRRFSLFNTNRWTPENVPACCSRVPVLYAGPFQTEVVAFHINMLKTRGSEAAPGYMQPEGVVVFHSAAGALFKVTCEHDEQRKSQVQGPA